MTDAAPIHTRPDGSIDTAFYMERGRRLRSAQAHRATTAVTTPRRSASFLVTLAALFVWPFGG